VAIICFFSGVLLTLSGYNRVEQLKAQTSHGSETYVPRSRFLIALGVIALLAAAAIGVFIGRIVFGSA
jgi:hypothetical protein